MCIISLTKNLENEITFLLLDLHIQGHCGLVVKAAGWLSLDRQFEPYLRAHTVAPSWCGLGIWDAVPEP
jgi:hypothetical protein